MLGGLFVGLGPWEPKALKTLLETGALSGVPEGDEETGGFVRKGYPNSLEGPKVWTLKIPWFGRFPFEMIFLFSQKSCFRFLRFGKCNPGFVVRMMCLFVLPVVLGLRGTGVGSKRLTSRLEAFRPLNLDCTTV